MLSFVFVKEAVNIIWFKKDLRTTDHEPLSRALATELPALGIFIFEPSVMQAPDAASRHFQFAAGCIAELREKLKALNIPLVVYHEEANHVFNALYQQFSIQSVYSHEETGNDVTFQRDIRMKHWFNAHRVAWCEYPSNAVVRGLKNRKNWTEHWKKIMFKELAPAPVSSKCGIDFPFNERGEKILAELLVKNEFQPAGRGKAERYLITFLENRHRNYARHISKPEQSRSSCSRLSPYLTWGVLSIREVVHASVLALKAGANKRQINLFLARIQWHCHFIQKFESQPDIEFHNLNKGFDHIRAEYNEEFIKAWKTGTTGIPIVDASMRCVCKTGYLNFRMRAMLVSFLTHHLLQPWQSGVHHLAQQFLDYEPGIHFCQFQMQAGTMGVNTIRIYNPIKQGHDHDPDAQFIKKWLPELEPLPTALAHTPWNMSEMESVLYNFKLGENYPRPIVNTEETGAIAREILWKTKASKEVKNHNKTILQKHTNRRTEREAPLFPMKPQ